MVSSAALQWREACGYLCLSRSGRRQKLPHKNVKMPQNVYKKKEAKQKQLPKTIKVNGREKLEGMACGISAALHKISSRAPQSFKVSLARIISANFE